MAMVFDIVDDDGGGGRPNHFSSACVPAKPISITSVPLKLKPIFFGIYAAIAVIAAAASCISCGR